MQVNHIIPPLPYHSILHNIYPCEGAPGGAGAEGELDGAARAGGAQIPSRTSRGAA